MAWNGSCGKAGIDVPPVRNRKDNQKMIGRGLIAGILVVAIGSVAAWWFVGRSDNSKSATKGTVQKAQRPISEAKPKMATKAVTATKTKAYGDMSREEKIKYWRDKYGDNLPDNIKPIVYYLENPPKEHYRGKSRPEAIFHRKSERQIAAFLSVTPGNWMMRPKVFDKRFDDDFAQSMAEKIEITPDDTEEQRKLKELVINAKKELAERLKAGETPSEIMTATAKELYDLGQYRQNLRKEVIAAQQDPNLSDQDVADLTEAANKMLEAKGLKGLRSIHPAIRQGYLARRAEKAAQKAAQEESAEGDK